MVQENLIYFIVVYSYQKQIKINFKILQQILNPSFLGEKAAAFKVFKFIKEKYV